jgi:hypothetical protein
MADCIAATIQGRVSLVDAANSLVFLRDQLDFASSEWLSELDSHVLTLESAGLIEPAQRVLMGSGFEELVLDALGRLDAIVRRHPAATGISTRKSHSG